MTTLELGLIGNSRTSALDDKNAASSVGVIPISTATPSAVIDESG